MASKIQGTVLFSRSGQGPFHDQGPCSHLQSHLSLLLFQARLGAHTQLQEFIGKSQLAQLFTTLSMEGGTVAPLASLIPLPAAHRMTFIVVELVQVVCILGGPCCSGSADNLVANYF